MSAAPEPHPGSSAADVIAILESLEDPRVRAVNEKHGDDHGVNLTKLRGVAKALKSNQDLSLELWQTGETAARLVAVLVAKPRAFSESELDTMLREAVVPKVHDWLVGYVVKKSPHAEALRVSWLGDPDPVVASAGWALTSDRVAKGAADVPAAELLDVIDAEMAEAPARLQWAMNWCLTMIGVHRADLRDRALEIGERLRVLEDYPTPPGCTSPYAPIAIAALASRAG